MAVDCCITKAPCGGEVTGRWRAEARWTGERGGIERSVAVDADGIPLGVITAAPANRHDSPLLSEPLDDVEKLGLPPEQVSVQLERGYDSDLTRNRLAERGLIGAISEKGKPAPLRATKRWVVERTNSSSWQNAHKKKLVWCVGRGGDGSRRLLGRLLERGDHHRGEARPKSLEPLPLGRSPFPQTITYWRSL